VTVHPAGFSFSDRYVATISVSIAGTLVLIADPWFICALTIALGLVWLGWSRPAIGIGIVAATIPLQEAILIPVGPAEITTTQLTVLPLAAGWFAAWLTGRHAIRLVPAVIAWSMVTGAMLVSGVNAVDRGEWLKESYRWGIALAMLVVAISSTRTVRDAWPILIGVSAGIASASAIAIRQVIQQDGPPSFSTGRLMRAYGFFGEPNPLAAYLEMSVLLILPLALLAVSRRSKSTAMRIGLPTVVLLGTGALALTQSRGGLLGFIAGVTLIAWFHARWTRLVLLGCALVMVPVLMFTSQGSSMLDRLTTSVGTTSVREQTTTGNWSVHERMAHWRAGWSMFESEPVIGIGAGNFDARYREHTDVWRFRIPRGHAHNGPIHVAAQTGFVGLVAYLALFFLAGARIARGVARACYGPARALSLGAMGVLIAVIVHGQFDYLHGLSLNLAFVIALAMSEPALHSERPGDARTGAPA
jgi:O-antigen ligase